MIKLSIYSKMVIIISYMYKYINLTYIKHVKLHANSKAFHQMPVLSKLDQQQKNDFEMIVS